ncbi:MAG: hypothetical protein HY300_03455 [Verrucomicrobia bacterium]|nr:hypothetical protein [Verrucomicrobiota bacterium]
MASYHLIQNPPRPIKIRSYHPTLVVITLLVTGSSQTVWSQDQTKTQIKTEHFDRDPDWEGHNNRLVPKNVTPITQNFGYSPDTHFAGKAAGEIGGVIVRATEPAFYADRIASRTLKDKFSASGTFAFTKSGGNSGIFFGWFNAKQPGGSRPVRSLGMDFDGEGRGVRLAVRMITGSNKSCGTFVTPFIPGKFRPTPIRNDGTRYAWTLAYDPDAAGGRGQFTFTLRSDTHPVEPISADLPAASQQEARNRFPLGRHGQPPHLLAGGRARRA